MGGSRWTAEELNTLMVQYKDHTAEQIQAQFLPNRSVYAIRMALHKYNLTEPQNANAHKTECARRNEPWTEAEDKILKRHFKTTPIQTIQKEHLPERSLKGIEKRAYRLGLKTKKASGKKKYSSSRKKQQTHTTWTQEEINILTQYHDDLTAEELREKYLPNKTARQIMTKLHNENMDQSRNEWSEKELKILKAHAATSTIKDLMKLLPGRTGPTISTRAYTLGIKIAENPPQDVLRGKNERWTERENSLIIQHYPNMTAVELQEKYLPKRTLIGVHTQIAKLRREGQIQRKEPKNA